MTDITTTCLQECIARYQVAIPRLSDLGQQLEHLTLPGQLNDLIGLYEQSYLLIEKALWPETSHSTGSDFHPLLACYQSLFREQDSLIRKSAKDDRHHFILSIPVADRPPHLRACLESIYQVCSLFGYGGSTSGQDKIKQYDRIKIIVAEDSRDEANIRRHLELIDEYRQKGLQIFHLGQDEQYDLLQSIPSPERERLGNILTTQPRERFYLKGQAANRNLSYLKYLQLTEDTHNTLYYLVDSDQSFCVNRQTDNGDEVVYALNYFHYIDKIFRTTDTRVLTGKMVGDPPVSPSVMAANFLDDISAFFSRLSETRSDEVCCFHARPPQSPDDAAYHDMAGLFGFDSMTNTFPYQCRLEGEHDNAACLRDVATRLNAFFFGEHLTRKTQFTYGNGFRDVVPARTIYPGNYIVNYAGLKYIIPFGHLRLRMSGPTAGRLIAAEIKQCFASVNLPHLHRRTTESGLGDDFRPGVDLAQQSIDLSNEFERQFFGDLMLFSTEALVARADVSQPFEKDLLVSLIEKKETELLALYQQKHDAILEKNKQLKDLVFDAGHWWTNSPELADTLQQVKVFIDNIENNFGEQCLAWQQIQSKEHCAQRKQQIIEALMQYRTERDTWDRLF